MGAIPKTEPLERPILFSAPMVRAILEGRKTQTRQIITPDNIRFFLSDGRKYKPPRDVFDEAYTDVQDMNCLRDGYAEWSGRGQQWMARPLSLVGERLWVRETWSCPDYSTRHRRRENVRYRATDGEELRWRSPIHMPRWASRILLEIVSVRVERLQEIRERDCDAEGLEPIEMEMRPHFRSLWESINGPGSWEANPWVWVVEFRRAEVA
jgi:hypothetical protein